MNNNFIYLQNQDETLFGPGVSSALDIHYRRKKCVMKRDRSSLQSKTKLKKRCIHLQRSQLRLCWGKWADECTNGPFFSLWSGSILHFTVFHVTECPFFCCREDGKLSEPWSSSFDRLLGINCGDLEKSTKYSYKKLKINYHQALSYICSCFL